MCTTPIPLQPAKIHKPNQGKHVLAATRNSKDQQYIGIPPWLYKTHPKRTRGTTKQKQPQSNQTKSKSDLANRTSNSHREVQASKKASQAKPASTSTSTTKRMFKQAKKLSKTSKPWEPASCRNHQAKHHKSLLCHCLASLGLALLCLESLGFALLCLALLCLALITDDHSVALCRAFQ